MATQKVTKTEEKTKKVPLEIQMDQTNLKDYTKEQLVKMVNATGGDSDFGTTYPDATFNRTLAYKYLMQKHDMDFVGRSYVVPHGVTIDDLLDAYEKQKCIGVASNTMQERVDGVDIVEVVIGEKKVRKTISMNAGAMERWEEFTKNYTNKSDYLSAACDLFIRKAKAGEVEMKAVFDFGKKAEETKK